MIEFLVSPVELFSSKFDPASLPPVEVEGLYLHIPFCVHKCHYCDFYSITRQSPQRMQAFVDLALREAKLWANLSTGLRIRPRTVFFGGGTPTLLPPAQMQRLIAGLRTFFDFSDCTEWTVEANPATVDADYCQLLRQAGVHRMSFGAQSFDRGQLAVLERHHDPDDVPRSVELARAAGFDRVNVDLIYAIPGQSMDSWMQSLQSALDLKTDHLSCYALTYEPNTPMAVRLRLGQFSPADPELELAMMRATRTRLSRENFHAYEISNYALPGQECRHNLMYWTGGNYIGLGPAAASHVQGWRWKNRPHLGEWESAVEKNSLPAADVEHLAPSKRAGELAMLLLRLSRGIEFAEFTARTGQNACQLYAEVIDRLAPTGLLEINDRAIRLSDQGIAVADEIAAEFLAVS